ncbi:MAG: aspartyl/glutamyl-tRNA amidotransferase subunit A [Candidatus Absconditabacterales bacterium]|nr:aspartyl/glutamyl-tRNA amidotransferase subunit A [Candidatus Absconditabacterales bacterium]
MSYTLTSYLAGVRSGSIHPRDVVSDYFFRAHKDTSSLNAWIYVPDMLDEDMLVKAIDLPFAAAPLGLKDNFMTMDMPTTCASRMLDGYIPPYDATAVTLCRDAGFFILGKTNMDEFAMGSSGETSAFGPTKNPLDITKVPGGSSSGSAAAVAADHCLVALGTDTGGSCRQPAAMCGIVGTKPTYGSISRFGIQPMANSLDQVGTLTKTLDDAVLTLNTLIEYDARDMMSLPRTKIICPDRPLSSFRIAVPDFAFNDGVADDIRHDFLTVIDHIRQAGARVDYVSLPSVQQGVAVYYVLCPAEVSSNMARFDGIKYGLRLPLHDQETLHQYMTRVRDSGFGPEVKRRIALGADMLRSENMELYFRHAQAMQEDMKIEVNKILTDYDVILSPTSPEYPWVLGSKSDDPIRMRLADIFTIPANLTGLPAISFPVGYFASSVFPFSCHLMGGAWDEGTLVTVAKHIQGLYGI